MGVVVVQGGGWAEDSGVAFASLAARGTAEQAVQVLSGLGRQDAQYAVGTVESGLAAWTGPATAGWSGHDSRSSVTVQGNTLVGDQVVRACHDAWTAAAADPLEERLLSALAAGVAAGGDLRGQQSAALLTIGADADAAKHDLRVDDARDPVGRLAELLVVLRAHELLQKAWVTAPADPPQAAALLRRAVQLSPEDGLVAQSAALVFMQAGLVDEASLSWRIALRTIPDPVARPRSWREHLAWAEPQALERLGTIKA